MVHELMPDACGSRGAISCETHIIVSQVIARSRWATWPQATDASLYPWRLLSGVHSCIESCSTVVGYCASRGRESRGRRYHCRELSVRACRPMPPRGNVILLLGTRVLRSQVSHPGALAFHAISYHWTQTGSRSRGNHPTEPHVACSIKSLHLGQYHLPAGVALMFRHPQWYHSMGQSWLSQAIIWPYDTLLQMQ